MQIGKLATISGPSGSGKDTIFREFLKRHPDWINPPSTTTRPPRAGEIAGKDMNFVDIDTFQAWQKEGKFLESFQVYQGVWYGTLAEPVEKLRSEGKNVFLRIDVQGALDVKQKLPETITIFIKPEIMEALKQRLEQRGSETADNLAERLRVAERELSVADQFDHQVINATDKQVETLEQVESVLL